jgi:hypothetical protein
MLRKFASIAAGLVLLLLSRARRPEPKSTSNTRIQMNASLDEYKTLRDETIKRLELQSQIQNFTLVFAAAMFTLAFGSSGYGVASLIYPIMALFFALGFVYNGLMIIQIGTYIRGLEAHVPGLGWAGYLKHRYWFFEFFQLLSTAGLFLGTESIGIILYSMLDRTKQTAPLIFKSLSWTAFALTVVAFIIQFIHQRLVYRRSP